MRRSSAGRHADEAAFLESVFVHTDGLYRYAIRLCSDPDVASDLVQDALTRGFDAFGRLRPDTNHRAWIYTILRNTYISRVRRAGREELLEEPATVIDIRRSHDPIAALVRREDGYRHGFEDPVLDALADLPEAQRTAVVLCDIEGLRYEEIAEVLDCPVGTVRSRIHHARKRLRAALGGYAHKRGYGRSDDVAL